MSVLCEATAASPIQLLDWDDEIATSTSEELLVLDCTHPTAKTLTHHKAQRRIGALPGAAGDSSTEIVLAGELLRYVSSIYN